MRAIKLSDISIPPNRQRTEIVDSDLLELSDSISRLGLLHPPVVRADGKGGYTLVAGERRLKAIDYLWNLGGTLKYEDKTFTEGTLPCNYLGEMDSTDAFEAELEENIRRTDLSWQERSTATAQLFELRRRKAAKSGQSLPLDQHGNEKVDILAPEIYPKYSPEVAETTVRRELIVAKYLDDPDVARAPTLKEAHKVIRRKEDEERSKALGIAVGKTFSREDHTLLKGNCLELLSNMRSDLFDVILTDPPYGINAQDFGDAGGKTGAGSSGQHQYDDSFEHWEKLMEDFSHLSYRVAKVQAHAYLFCDILNFMFLKAIMKKAGWRVFRTPLIWNNPSGQRAPWPQHGPQRKYQGILYAIKGDKPTIKMGGDILTYPSDPNLNWAAQKPVALYQDLLMRSARFGDTILDPFAGSGTIFPACHPLKMRATGIEMDEVAYGIAAERLGALK